MLWVIQKSHLKYGDLSKLQLSTQLSAQEQQRNACPLLRAMRPINPRDDEVCANHSNMDRVWGREWPSSAQDSHLLKQALTQHHCTPLSSQSPECTQSTDKLGLLRGAKAKGTQQAQIHTQADNKIPTRSINIRGMQSFVFKPSQGVRVRLKRFRAGAGS